MISYLSEMKLYCFFYVCLLGLIFSSCQDDDIPLPCTTGLSKPCEKNITLTPAPDTCFDFTFTKPSGVEYVVLSSDTFVQNPVLNPISKEELIYRKIIPNHMNSEPIKGILKKVDLCKGEKQILRENLMHLILRFDWHINDWLTYDNNGFEIWKIKANGDSLIAISPNKECRYPTFNAASNLLYCSCAYEAPLYQLNTYMTLDGSIVDTSDIVSAIYDYHNGKTVTFKFVDGERYIGYIDMPTQEFVSVLPREEAYNGSISDMGWLDDEYIIWIDRKGLHKVNILTSEMETLNETCPNAPYREFTVVPGHPEIYLTRVFFSYLSDAAAIGETYITLFDTETGEEWIVDLD